MAKRKKSDTYSADHRIRCLGVRAMVNKTKSNTITHMHNFKGKMDTDTKLKTDLLEVGRAIRSLFSFIIILKRYHNCFFRSWLFSSLLRSCLHFLILVL